MIEKSVIYEVSNQVATITLNRPKLKNALNQEALNALVRSIDDARSNDDVWLVMIKANGTDFCVGQDIKELSEKGNKGDYFEPVFTSL